MKWGVIRPDGVNWRWDLADRLVKFAAANSMHVLGHTLVWHSQVPRQVFSDADGRQLTREALVARMEEHIDTLVDRYRGRVHTWDVVNEAIDEDKGWRRSPWFNIIGEDFMELAFRRARRADPAAKLLYNDYNMHNPGKREFLVKLLRDWLDRGVPIDGIGLQGHLGLDYPDLEEWERSIIAYEDLGLEVHVTELDVDVLPSPYEMSAEISNRFEYSRENDPWPDGLTEEMQQRLADRYEQIFRILLRHKAVRRVTFWGLHDGISWKNDFPIRGRTNHPLLFDRNLERKPAWQRLVQLAQQ
jgi:endo-1,4-beta-xylanase